MRRLFLLLGFIACVSPAQAAAAIVSLNPVADAFVTGGSTNPNSGSPTANYGGAGALQVSASGSFKGEIQTLLKFDLTAAKAAFDDLFGPGNWFVDSIKLQLGTNFGTQGAQPNNPIFNSINAGLFKIDWLANDLWGEGTGTPASPFTPANPPVDGVTFASLGALVGANDELLGAFTYTPVGNTSLPSIPPASYGLALTTGFVADVSAGSSVSLRAYAGDTGVSYLFNSQSIGITANRPTLIVSAVPEPGIPALLTGIAFMQFARRRRYANTT